MFVLFRTMLLLLLISLTFAVYSAEKLETNVFASMENEVNKEPWLSYQKLLSWPKSYDEFTDEQKLWFLLRQAQAENLLYFYPKFEKTVAKAHSLITGKTPAKISTAFNLYSGLIFQRAGRYADAIAILAITVKQAKINNLPYLSVLAQQELAYTHSLTELFETSLAGIQTAYVEAYTIDDDFLIAVINEVYGAMYAYMNQYEKSIEYYQKALLSYQQLGYRAHVAETVYGLATTYRYWKKYQLATENFKRYESLVSYTPNTDITFYSAYGLGMTLAEQGKCAEGLVVIAQALKLNGFSDYNAELYKRQAVCFITMGQFAQAQQAIDAANAIFITLPELEGTRWQLAVIKIQAQLTHAQGDYVNAYALLAEYYEQYNVLMEKYNSAHLLRVRSALELERQKAEIAMLEQRTKIQQLQVEQQKHRNTQQTYIIFVATVVVVFVLFVIFLQHQSKKKIVAVSVRDPLSNLYNRRYMFDFLGKLVRSAKVKNGDVSVMMIDIDNFKQINDLYGHPFGDEVIRKLADIGQDTLRVGDMMGRVGGEEFLCTLPRTDTKQCLQIAKRLLENINSHVFYIQEQKVQITLSIGIATLSTTIVDAPSLYACADKALYYVKNNGKNNVAEYYEHMMYTYQESNAHPINTDEFS